ncbi:MAG: septum formation protein Maf [Chloroflexi bacterium]|nr:septum formation protein Maf [Chloroflexota bacterium]
MTSSDPLRLILASGSPRRRELLGLTGLAFEVVKVEIDENPYPGEAAQDYTVRLSHTKAQAALDSGLTEGLILAADTTVADGNAILGKPADPDEARTMLRQLRGRVHQGYTALTLLNAANGQRVTEVAITGVPMRDYTDDEIEAYIATGDPFDKAGSYAIQHAGFHPTELTSGCYANVVGLPLCHLLRALRVFGVVPKPDVPLLCQQHHRYTCDVSASILAVPYENRDKR